MSTWRTRWGYEIATKASRPGIWRLKAGGYLVTSRVRDGKGGRSFRAEAMREAKSVHEAVQRQNELRSDLLAAVKGRTRRTMLFSEFVASLFERKVLARDLKSKATVELWSGVLQKQLIPTFGNAWCHELRYVDFVEWRDKVLAPRMALPETIEVERRVGRAKNAPLVKRTVKNPAHLKPNTANGWFRILRVITKAMAAELELARDPAIGLRNFDTSEDPTYTEENPNAATPAQARRFLAELERRYPQHYAFALLGFVSGQRPSSLRPLRRKGASPDVLWDDARVLIRRSNSRAGAVMNTTKTGARNSVEVPLDVLEVLRQHADGLDRHKRRRIRESEYLFPSRTGGMMARTALYKPFIRIAEALGLPRLTPRAMRRTFQDLARAVGIESIVKRAISGHATEEMEHHYSTVSAAEKRAATTQISGLLQGSAEPPRAVTRAVETEEK